MRKFVYLFLCVFTLVAACKKPTSDVEFKFTKIEGNKSSASTGILKVAWQDDKNSSWDIILYNLTDGTNKIISTNTKSINETVIIGNEYRVVPVGGTKPIDTTTPCKGNKIELMRIGSMPDLFTIPSSCPTSALALSTIFAEKANATQGLFSAGFTSTGNTTWTVKVTNTATSDVTTTNTAIVETGNINIPLDVPQLVEIIGDQDGAKASFKVLVETNENVVISDFYK